MWWDVSIKIHFSLHEAFPLPPAWWYFSATCRLAVWVAQLLCPQIYLCPTQTLLLQQSHI